MADWTTDQVENRLEEAAYVLKLLPEEKVQGYFTAWPEVVHSFADRIGQLPVPMRPPRPSPAAITRMEEALMWIRFLEIEDGKLVWARIEKTPWKHICWNFGITRTTANRRWQYGLAVIALRLNGRRIVTRRSIEHVIKRAKTLSRKNDGAVHFFAVHRNG